MRKTLPYELRRWAGTWRLLPVLCILLVAISAGRTSEAPLPKTPPSDVPASREKKISPKKPKNFFAQVDEILEFVSEDTDLPNQHPVKPSW